MNQDAQAKLPLNHVLLTARDLTVLRSLYDNVVMTYGQIADRHFPNVSKPTVINRLTKIERGGFIRRERIPRMELGRDKRAIGVVYQITKDGISKLRDNDPSGSFRSYPIRIHPYSLSHDLILVDLAGKLTNLFGFGTVVNGKLVSSNNQMKGGLEPDLILTLPTTKEIVAIELELSDKSEKRYREIVLRYRLLREYAKVIYFVGNPFIQQVVTRTILNRNPHREERPRTGKFYFSSLEAFLNSPDTASISNGASDIREKGVEL